MGRADPEIVVYHYPRCSTCVKARRWLEAAGVPFTLVDIVDAPPSRDALAGVVERGELEVGKLFNTSGQSYRQGDFKARRATMTTDECVDALAADGKLIKRPLVLASGVALAGFREPAWSEALAPWIEG